MVDPDFFAGWLALDRASLPDPTRGPYLTTNVPDGRNAHHMPSHVWVVACFHADQADEVCAFVQDTKIWGCKLYRPVFPAPSALSDGASSASNAGNSGMNQ